MQSNISRPQNSRRSHISCLSCRRRKVKCDRKFPQCLICEQNSIVCNYPSGPLKPGPKIGFQQRQRKRSRDDDVNNNGGHDPTTPRLDPTTPDNVEHSTPLRNGAGEFSSPTEYTLFTGDTQDKRASNDRISDLSFILHPSHEASSPENERGSNSGPSPGDSQQYDAIDKACSVLGLGQRTVERMVKTYFNNMVAINLFHEPTFSEKLSRISSPTQLSALLAAMLTFAVRFYPDESGELHDRGIQGGTNQRAAHFLNMALKYVDESLRDCGDSTPPLCVLQAAIIAAHCQLNQGVLGRAWRSLGTCVRLAYEMNLHLIDIRSPRDLTAVDADQWCQDEEKRRTWWATWEMDVFATTIRRTPPAVDWSQIETLLPVEDEYWFQHKPRPSCFLETDPVYRWKALQDSGNQSPKAWFIVINSLMKNAQRISSPRGVPNLSPQNDNEPASPSRSRSLLRPNKVKEARQKLETIANAVQCFRMALPNHLKYHDQYLGFDARVLGQYTSLRQQHCSIYNIFMMTQLARLMIYRYDVFKGQYRAALSTHGSSDSSTANQDRANPPVNKDDSENLAMKQYFEAADALLTIVNRSCDDHIKYINPFLSNTIWLASAVHLVRSQFCRPGMNKAVIKSRFEVLNLTYKKCVNFWDMHTAVQQNLESLEEQLEACQRSDENGQESSLDNQSTNRIRTKSHGLGIQERSNTLEPPNIRQPLSHGTNIDHGTPVSYLRNANQFNASHQSSQPERASAPSSVSSSNVIYTTDWQARPPGNTADTRTSNTSILDFMQLPPQQNDTSSEVPNHIPMSSGVMIDQMPYFDATQSQGAFIENTGVSDIELDLDWSWKYPRLPSDLQDMLSDVFTS